MHAEVTFEAFVAARLPALLRFAGALTGDRATAEDVVQEVLIRAHVRWRHIDALKRPEAYVQKMIVNEFLSWRRRFKRIQTHAEVPQVRDDAPDHATTYGDRDALRTELARLPRRQRAVLVLRYYAGMTDNEIAGELGCTAGTVRGYASRALATLRVSELAQAADSKRGRRYGPVR
ncbi:MAG TPA: SigE family RNA polymerase sigma factor [Micromonosporaceae bacterium]